MLSQWEKNKENKSTKWVCKLKRRQHGVGPFKNHTSMYFASYSGFQTCQIFLLFQLHIYESSKRKKKKHKKLKVANLLKFWREKKKKKSKESGTEIEIALLILSSQHRICSVEDDIVFMAIQVSSSILFSKAHLSTGYEFFYSSPQSSLYSHKCPAIETGR